MKTTPLILHLLILFPILLQGQVVITSDDMPAPGDTLRVSLTTLLPPGYAQSGYDTIWDFSMLEAMNQRVDTFVSINQTPVIYQLFFVPDVVSNLASPKGVGSFIPGFPVEEFYTFYKNSSTSFTDAGFAFTLDGFPFPAKYDSPDIYYTFPLDTNAAWNSTSAVEFNIPGMLYFSTSRSRSSFVDGWGTLATPFGTFETIRVRSDLLQFDSLYVDSLGFGMGFNRNITEYKWLAPGMGLPVLQINQEGPLATATYRDHMRFPSVPLTVSIGPDTLVTKGAVVTMHATINGGAPPYRLFWSTLDTAQTITVTMDTTTTFGIVVVDALNTFAIDDRLITVVMPGIGETTLQPLHLYPNPARDAVHITLPTGFSGGTLTLRNPQGQDRLSIVLPQSLKTYTCDLSGNPPGLYCLTLQTTHAQHISKLIIH